MKTHRILPLVLLLTSLVSCSPPKSLHLAEMDLSQMSAGWGYSKKDQSVTESKLSINGKTYEKGIGTHAVSTFLLDLGSTAKRFEALVGVDDNSDEEASMRFYVIGDGEILWQSCLRYYISGNERILSDQRFDKINCALTDLSEIKDVNWQWTLQL